MSVVAIVLAKNEVAASALMELQKILSTSLSELKSLVTGGQPILEIEIFDGDYQSHAAIIKSVLKVIYQEQLVADFYEIHYGEQYPGNPNLNVWRIDETLLEDILAAADKEVDRQKLANVV